MPKRKLRTSRRKFNLHKGGKANKISSPQKLTYSGKR